MGLYPLYVLQPCAVRDHVLVVSIWHYLLLLVCMQTVWNEPSAVRQTAWVDTVSACVPVTSPPFRKTRRAVGHISTVSLRATASHTPRQFRHSVSFFSLQFVSERPTFLWHNSCDPHSCDTILATHILVTQFLRPTFLVTQFLRPTFLWHNSLWRLVCYVYFNSCFLEYLNLKF